MAKIKMRKSETSGETIKDRNDGNRREDRGEEAYPDRSGKRLCRIAVVAIQAIPGILATNQHLVSPIIRVLTRRIALLKRAHNQI